MADQKYLEELSKKFADNGKLIEAGWVAMRRHMIPPGAPANQLSDMRLAYMAGAQHLFSSIINILDEGNDATEDDMDRLNLIGVELELFYKELLLRQQKPAGSG